MVPAVFQMVVGATLPSMDFVYQNQDGTAVDLTGYRVELDVKRPDGTLFTVRASLTEPTNGKATFFWANSTWTQAGKHHSQFVVTTPTGDVLKQGDVIFDVASSYR